MLNTLPVLPSLVKSNPALPLPTFVKVPATALASRPCEISIDLDTPKNLTATERNIIIALTWNSVSGADKYNIHYATETFANIEVVYTCIVEHSNFYWRFRGGCYFVRSATFKSIFNGCNDKIIFCVDD
jgi:hypothetical protein